jgi:hypothetical protein
MRAVIEMDLALQASINKNFEQICTMDLNMGGSVANLGGVLHGHEKHSFAGCPITSNDGLSLKPASAKGVLQSKGAQNLDSVRSNANSGASLSVLARLFKNLYVESALAQRKCRRQSA